MNDEIRMKVEQIRREWDGLSNEVFGSLIKAVDHLRNEQIAGISVADAIERIRLELLSNKEPGSYYHTWQSNIAMCFYDAVRHKMPGVARVHDVHQLANQAAARFLDILCLDNNNIGLIKQEELPKSQPPVPPLQQG